MGLHLIFWNRVISRQCCEGLDAQNLDLTVFALRPKIFFNYLTMKFSIILYPTKYDLFFP